LRISREATTATTAMMAALTPDMTANAWVKACAAAAIREWPPAGGSVRPSADALPMVPPASPAACCGSWAWHGQADREDHPSRR
jgi:hypothetical protein